MQEIVIGDVGVAFLVVFEGLAFLVSAKIDHDFVQQTCRQIT